MNLVLDYYKQYLSYSPESGVFIWVKRPCKRVIVGAIAGSPSNGERGYRQIQLNKKKVSAHRLAWLYMTGEWPEDEIDHINGYADDNSWINLRDVKSCINSQNIKKAQKNNKMGLLGVSVYSNGKYIARISVNKRRVYLGSFDSPEEAHNVYIKAKRELHEGCEI